MSSYVSFHELSWNKNDLQACKNIAAIVLSEYGVDVLNELNKDGLFGSFDINSLFEL